MTTQMLLNSKRLVNLVLHNECVVRFALSLFQRELKRVVCATWGVKGRCVSHVNNFFSQDRWQEESEF